MIYFCANTFVFGTSLSGQLQAQTLINRFKHLEINQPVHIADVNYVLSPFEGNINTGYPTGLKIYLHSTKEIDKETDELDISVSNVKDIIDHFLSLSNKYFWVRLALMANTGTCAKNIFRVVYHIYLADMHI